MEETITKRKNNQKQQLTERLKKSPIIQIACQKIGIARATYYRWRNEDVEFAKEADIALSEGKSFINDMAESQLINKIRDSNLTAIIFWLKNHHQEYTDKLQISGNGIKDRDLTPEEIKLIKNAMKISTKK